MRETETRAVLSSGLKWCGGLDFGLWSLRHDSILHSHYAISAILCLLTQDKGREKKREREKEGEKQRTSPSNSCF